MLGRNKERHELDALAVFVQKSAELRKTTHPVECAFLKLVELIGNFSVNGSFCRKVKLGEYFGELVLGVDIRLEEEFHARGVTPLGDFFAIQVFFHFGIEEEVLLGANVDDALAEEGQRAEFVEIITENVIFQQALEGLEFN